MTVPASSGMTDMIWCHYDAELSLVFQNKKTSLSRPGYKKCHHLVNIPTENDHLIAKGAYEP